MNYKILNLFVHQRNLEVVGLIFYKNIFIFKKKKKKKLFNYLVHKMHLRENYFLNFSLKVKKTSC